jgi:GT2 family glycosyltransferase
MATIETPLPRRVVAAIVTHRRPVELRRLLQSLAGAGPDLLGVVISDHAPGGETRALAAQAAFPVWVLENPANPGPGAGWRAAAQAAGEIFPELDAVWFLDDDVVVEPDTLTVLLREMGRAGAIAPLLCDAEGLLWAFPEPVPLPLRTAIRTVRTPSEARQRLGDDPIALCWCTGACFLVSRATLAEVGGHRDDFWILGEDLEFSMRVAAHTRAVFTCQATVRHLPPAGNPATLRRGDYIKFCALLQNLCYLTFHSPHSRHMRTYLAGNFRRFFRTHGLTVRTIRDAVTVFVAGAGRGEPAGGPTGQALRQRITSYDF